MFRVHIIVVLLSLIQLSCQPKQASSNHLPFESPTLPHYPAKGAIRVTNISPFFMWREDVNDVQISKALKIGRRIEKAEEDRVRLLHPLEPEKEKTRQIRLESLRELNSQKRVISNLEEQIEALDKVLKEYPILISDIDKEISKVKGELNNLPPEEKDKRKELEEKLAKLEVERAQYKKELDEAPQLKVKAEADLESANIEYAKIEKKYQIIDAEYKRISSKIRKIESKIECEGSNAVLDLENIVDFFIGPPGSIIIDFDDPNGIQIDISGWNLRRGKISGGTEKKDCTEEDLNGEFASTVEYDTWIDDNDPDMSREFTSRVNSELKKSIWNIEYETLGGKLTFEVHTNPGEYYVFNLSRTKFELGKSAVFFDGNFTRFRADGKERYGIIKISSRLVQ